MSIIFSFGAVSRGAIYALKAHGFRDITICIQRPDHEVREEILDCNYVRIRTGAEGEARMIVVEHDGSERPLSALIVHLPTVIAGPGAWQRSDTIRRALNVVDGVVQKPAILAFQKRQPAYPHLPLDFADAA